MFNFTRSSALSLGLLATLCASPTLLADSQDTVNDAAVLPDDTPSDQGTSGLSFGSDDRFQLNGFMSTGVSQTNADDGADYNIPEHGAITNNTSFDSNTLIGLQLSAKLNEKFSVVGQFVSSGDDTNGNTAYDVDASWAYLQYQPSDNVQVEIGRMRIPLFLYSDTIQVGYSNPYLFLANEVYRTVPFDNMNGISTIYHHSLGTSGWTLEVQPFFGADTSQYDVVMVSGVTSLTDFDENSIYGTALSASNGNITVRGAYSKLQLTATNDLASFQEFSDQPTSFYSFGGKINMKNILLQGEYAHRDVPEGIAELTSYYATLGYRLDKFMPTLTYGHLKTDNQDSLTGSDEAPEAQESYTLALAYYLSSNLDLKLSLSDIRPQDGTNGMFSSDPGKSDVLLYGLGVDAIF